MNTLFHYKKKIKANNNTTYFNSIIIMNNIPNEDSLKEGDFAEVVYKNQSYWAIFMCPCGCKNVISLPLQKCHKIYWKLKPSIDNKPTLYPSIRQNNGCMSHFWIIKGKIKWCRNRNKEPR